MRQLSAQEEARIRHEEMMERYPEYRERHAEGREPTEAETTGYQIRLIARLLVDIVEGNREDRAREGLSTDRDTQFRVLPDSLRHGQLEEWIGALRRAAALIDPANYYDYKS